MVLGKIPVPGRPTIWITVGQGPTTLVVGADGGCLEIFTLIYPFPVSFSLSLGDGLIYFTLVYPFPSSFSLSLWETARYRLKYFLKGPLNPKQPTTQINQYILL